MGVVFVKHGEDALERQRAVTVLIDSNAAMTKIGKRMQNQKD